MGERHSIPPTGERKRTRTRTLASSFPHKQARATHTHICTYAPTYTSAGTVLTADVKNVASSRDVPHNNPESTSDRMSPDISLSSEEVVATRHAAVTMDIGFVAPDIG